MIAFGRSIQTLFRFGFAALLCLAFGLNYSAALEPSKTLIVNKSSESIYYAKAVWVQGKNPGGAGAGIAAEATNYYDIYGWFEVKPGKTESVDWLPYIRIEKGGKALHLPEATSREKKFPMTTEDEFKLTRDEKAVFTEDDVPKKKGYVLGRGFFEYRNGVATVHDSSRTLEDPKFTVRVPASGQQAHGTNPTTPKVATPPAKTSENERVLFEISLEITNTTNFEVGFNTVGTSVTPHRQTHKTTKTYTFEIDSAKGGQIVVSQTPIAPKKVLHFNVNRDGKWRLESLPDGSILLRPLDAALLSPPSDRKHGGVVK